MLQITLDAADTLMDRAVRPRILNATSGSPASASATAAAALLANERDAELVVVHVGAPEVMRVSRLGPTIVHSQRERDPHASPVLSAARQVAWANGAFARVILISGEPAPAILSLAVELAVDLIVIGARPSRAPALLVDPTRYRIVRAAPRPVRVIALASPPRPMARVGTVPAR
ncbi:MAG: universal stress protein [Candidatus Eremiobacteraeota bacterium]|nr:universal stress protein [Candidatus Eremiobacteraeota bacterium]